ncbi:MAG: hypothetical protein EBU57_02915, partial [Alphaproteobacteria bacterium]|nr:hypothetical protein [Alphaproteobacteria bacterium]
VIKTFAIYPVVKTVGVTHIRYRILLQQFQRFMFMQDLQQIFPELVLILALGLFHILLGQGKGRVITDEYPIASECGQGLLIEREFITDEPGPFLDETLVPDRCVAGVGLEQEVMLVTGEQVSLNLPESPCFEFRCIACHISLT